MTEVHPGIITLEEFFAKAKLPKQVDLYPGIKIVDTAGFIESHLEVLKANGTKGVFDVFYVRLARLKEILTTK